MVFWVFLISKKNLGLTLEPLVAMKNKWVNQTQWDEGRVRDKKWSSPKYIPL